MSSEPPVLSYDKPNSESTRRSHWIIPGYCAGIQAASLIHAVISTLILTRGLPDLFSRVMYGVVLPVSFAFVSLLPQILFLGTALWLKKKLVREVRFGGFREAFWWGFAGGVFPFPLLPVWQNVGAPPEWIGFVVLGWFAIFPVAAGLFLCRHSHVRG